MKREIIEAGPREKKVEYHEGILGRTEDEAMNAALSGLTPSERKALERVGKRLADRLNGKTKQKGRNIRGLGPGMAIEIFTKALMLDGLAEEQPGALKRLGVDINARVGKK